MKPLHVFLFLLSTSIPNVLKGQTSSPIVNQTSPGEQYNDSKKNKPLQIRANEDFYHQHKFLNDCSSLAREDYKLPPEYISNYVQITEWQSYRGTRNGIIMTDNKTPIRITTENSKIPENNITALALFNGEELWIGTYSSGIVIGTGKDVKPFKIQAIQSHDLHVVSLSVDAAGLVWAVYQNGGIECFLNGISCRYFPKD